MVVSPLQLLAAVAPAISVVVPLAQGVQFARGDCVVPWTDQVPAEHC